SAAGRSRCRWDSCLRCRPLATASSGSVASSTSSPLLSTGSVAKSLSVPPDERQGSADQRKGFSSMVFWNDNHRPLCCPAVQHRAIFQNNGTAPLISEFIPLFWNECQRRHHGEVFAASPARPGGRRSATRPAVPPRRQRPPPLRTPERG